MQGLLVASVFVTSIAAAASSVPVHKAQAAACRVAFARERAAAHDDAAKANAAAREEDCLVEADNSVLSALAPKSEADDAADPTDVVQTYRDASTGFCNVLTEKNGSLEGQKSLEQVDCMAERESELARLVDEYAAGGGGATAIASGASACDDPLKGVHGGAEMGAWSSFEGCVTAQANAKVSAFVPKRAVGDPLGVLGHSPEQIAMTLTKTFEAGTAVCDVLVGTHASAERDRVRGRCRAAAVANVSKAVEGHAK